jgi:hypothetical protein
MFSTRHACVLVAAATGLPSTVLATAPQEISQTVLTNAPIQAPLDTDGAEAPYRFLDNVEGPWVNLNVAPVRPMALTADQLNLYAVNTNASLVQHYANLNGQPTDTFRVPWGPVSIAIWPDFSEAELLVVCRGTHVLARLDRITGETLSTLDLPFEPADIAVDHTRDRAFVACSGDDSVVEIDLLAGTIVETYDIPGKHPFFLSFDASGTNVLVAPMFSGNNSIAHRTGAAQVGFLGIIDLETSQFVLEGLPDEDLFRIDPLAGTVEAVLKDVGTVLFAHGVNPVTGDLWQLNTDANNKDPNAVGEPAINGFAVANRLSITQLPNPGDPINEIHTVIDLDDTDPNTSGVQYDPAQSVGQPYSLEFDASGNALITGLLTDNVTGLDSAGNFITEFDLEDGAIPRQTLLWGNSSVFVYCWGTSSIEMWDLGGGGWTRLAILTVGHDPAPELVQEGRKVFYDASHSLNNNQSCASCHIDGRTDMIVWDLSDLPRDDKGPMVTQTLASTVKTGPFHWRGERPTLLDFNGAFEGLLGGAKLDETPGGEFDQFQAFVFSMHATANPNADRRRILSDATTTPPPIAGFPEGSPVRGQDLFIDVPTDGQSCAFCHTLPTSSSDDIVPDSAGDQRPQRTSLDVTHFFEMWRKEQPTAGVLFVNQVELPFPLTGAGLAHGGTINGIFDFVNFFNITNQEVMDIFTFCNAIDQGLAPMVHEAEYLDASTVDVAVHELTRFFLPQAEARNIDLAAYGTFDIGDGRRSLAWYWDRDDELFHAEDSSVTPRRLRFFVEQAEAGSGTTTFVGLPVGMAKPWAADFDADGLVNLDETTTSPVVADSDGDTFLDGYEVLHDSDPNLDTETPSESVAPEIRNLQLQWITARKAKLAWQTDEPTTFSIDYFTSTGPVQTVTGDALKTVHTAFLRNLLPSTQVGGPSFTYSGTLTAFDNSGNPASAPLPTDMTTAFFLDVDREVVLGDLVWAGLTPTLPSAPLAFQDAQQGGVFTVLDAVAEARVDRKVGGPPFEVMQDYVVVAAVHVNGVVSTSFTTTSPTTFTVNGNTPVFLTGPYVISPPTGLSGIATLEFTQPGLGVGDEVRLNIEAVVPIDPELYDPDNPDFGDEDTPFPLGLWDFPTTPAAFRALTTTF